MTQNQPTRVWINPDDKSCMVCYFAYIITRQPLNIRKQTLSHLRKNKCILFGWGSQETINNQLVYVYDIIIFPVGFSFVLSPFQYHNAQQKAQMRYRLSMLKVLTVILQGRIQRQTNEAKEPNLDFVERHFVPRPCSLAPI